MKIKKLQPITPSEQKIRNHEKYMIYHQDNWKNHRKANYHHVSRERIINKDLIIIKQHENRLNLH
jgi:hypothetical protein